MMEESGHWGVGCLRVAWMLRMRGIEAQSEREERSSSESARGVWTWGESVWEVKLEGE